MSLYNMINGVNPATFYFMPMLGIHPDQVGRFRDCFLRDDERPEYDKHICIYTRLGGGNRDYHEDDIQELRDHDCYVDDYDDSFDCTYATFVFSVPDEWKEAYESMLQDDFSLANITKEYEEQIVKIYPKLESQIREQLAQARNELTDN